MIQDLLKPELSATTGKPLEIRTELITLTFRGKSFEVSDSYWYDAADGSDFTTAPLSDITQRLLYSAYREKHGTPFPEIIELRQRYGISARAMSTLLGIDVNQYRLYEGGEVPSEPIGKLIAASLQSTHAFKRLPESRHGGIAANERQA